MKPVSNGARARACEHLASDVLNCLHAGRLVGGVLWSPTSSIRTRWRVGDGQQAFRACACATIERACTTVPRAICRRAVRCAGAPERRQSFHTAYSTTAVCTLLRLASDNARDRARPASSCLHFDSDALLLSFIRLMPDGGRPSAVRRRCTLALGFAGALPVRVNSSLGKLIICTEQPTDKQS